MNLAVISSKHGATPVVAKEAEDLEIHVAAWIAHNVEGTCSNETRLEVIAALKEWDFQRVIRVYFQDEEVRESGVFLDFKGEVTPSPNSQAFTDIHEFLLGEKPEISWHHEPEPPFARAEFYEIGLHVATVSGPQGQFRIVSSGSRTLTISNGQPVRTWEEFRREFPDGQLPAYGWSLNGWWAIESDSGVSSRVAYTLDEAVKEAKRVASNKY